MAKIKTFQGNFYYKRKFLYLGIKQIDKNIAFENLTLLNNLLSKKQIIWGPILGTLLGIVRDNDFITWDEDTDLYILKEDEEKLKNTLWEMKKLGFELIRYERRGLYSVMRKGEYIDFYILKKISKDIRHSGGPDFIFDKYLTDTIKWDFKGIKLNIPREYEDFLSFHYGNWKTPIKYANFETNKSRKLFLKIKSIIKNNLPDFLYYPLLRMHHQKDFRKFKEKCKIKGIPISKNIII